MQYQGTELALFEKAENWKSYFSRLIRPYLHGDVLEVGAGIGANTAYLQKGVTSGKWTCLEPDAAMSAQLRGKVTRGEVTADVTTGTVSDLPEASSYDSILYIDVLEHIERDREEVERVARLLRPGGVLIILSPSHPFLFSDFDKAIGHFRRYQRGSLLACIPPQLKRRKLVYLDSVGFFASLANRMLLKQSQPTEGQILLWDRVMVPLSRIADPILLNRFGKTILGIWEK